ncbi:unnamed protein product, partial [Musa hybrid cultivar]
LPTFRFPGAPKSSSKLVLFQDQLEPPQSPFHLSMEKAPTLAANRFHDDSNKEPETLEDKLMRRLSSFSTVIPFSLVIHSLRSLQRLTIWPIYLLGPAPRQKTRRVFLNLGRFGLQTL